MKIKNRWEDVTLGEFIQIDQILNADISADYKQSNLIAILSGEEENTISSLPMSVFLQLSKAIGFINTQPTPGKIRKSYEINGKKYECHADLTKISTSQYMDYSAGAKENDVIAMLSSFLIPKGHKYNEGYDIKEVRTDIENMKFLDATSIAFFIRKQYAASLIVTQHSLEERLKAQGKTKTEIEETITPLRNSIISYLSSTW